MGLDMRRMAAAALDAAFEDEGPQERPQTRQHSAVKAVAAGLVLGGAARIALARASTLRELRGALKVTNRLREAPDRVRETVADRFTDLRERVGGIEFGEAGSGEPAPETDLEADEELEEPEREEPAAEAEDSEAEEADEPQAEGPEEPEPEEPEEPQAEEPEGPEAEDEAAAQEPEAAGEEEDAGEEGSRGGGGSGGAEVFDALVGEDRDEAANPGTGGSNTPDVLSLLNAHREPPPVLSRLGERRRVAPTRRPPAPPKAGSRARSSSRQSTRASKS